MPFSRSRLPSRSREPRVQAASTVRRRSRAQVAACSANWLKASPLAWLPDWVKITPGRPPASMPPAASSLPYGLNWNSGP